MLNGFLKYTISFPNLISSSHMHHYCSERCRTTKINYRQEANFQPQLVIIQKTKVNKNSMQQRLIMPVTWKATGHATGVQVLAGVFIFLIFQKIQSFIRWVPRSRSPAVTRPKHEADALLISAEVKNKWSFTCYLHPSQRLGAEVQRRLFTFV